MRPVAALAFLFFLAVPRPVHAWTDARPAGLVTELAVDREGGATVTLRIHWRILAGRFRTFELAELPSDMTLLEGSAADATGNPVPVATRVPAPSRLEVTLGEDGGLRRGAIDVVLRYTTSLRAQGLIHREGDDALLEVATIPWERGLEAAELRVALPSSVRRAEWRADETPGVDATVESELGRDVVHVIRRHLPAGVRWTGRIACDPALFPWLVTTQHALTTAHQSLHRSALPAGAAAGVLALVFGLAMLVLRRRGDSIVPLPRSLRWLPAALAATGGAVQGLVMLDVAGVVTLGALLIATGFALIVPSLEPSTTSDAAARFWPEDRALATVGARPWPVGSMAMVLMLTAAVASCAFAIVKGRAPAAVAGLDLALLTLAAATVRRRLTPERDAAVLAPVVRRIARRLRADRLARPVWRVRGDGSAPGSVTVRILPRPGGRLARGVRSIECAVAWTEGTLVWRAVPVLSIRIDRGSPLERTLRTLALTLGTLETDGDDGWVWVADMVGPDRRAVVKALARLMKSAVSPEREAIEVAPRADVVASEALA